MSTETEVAELFPNTLVRISDISSFISWYIKQTSSMKKKFNYTHEYWLESFLPISGQFIFWRSIRMMQMKRIKFICGEYITRVMWEKHWGISHCKDRHKIWVFFLMYMGRCLWDSTHKQKCWIVALACGKMSISKLIIWVVSVNWQHISHRDALPAIGYWLSTEKQSVLTVRPLTLMLNNEADPALGTTASK